MLFVMQGTSAIDSELLDAAAPCGQLVPEGSVHAFLAGHRMALFPDELLKTCSLRVGGVPRCPPM